MLSTPLSWTNGADTGVGGSGAGASGAEVPVLAIDLSAAAAIIVNNIIALAQACEVAPTLRSLAPSKE